MMKYAELVKRVYVLDEADRLINRLHLVHARD